MLTPGLINYPQGWNTVASMDSKLSPLLGELSPWPGTHNSHLELTTGCSEAENVQQT